jgi:hypothetical protein
MYVSPSGLWLDGCLNPLLVIYYAQFGTWPIIQVRESLQGQFMPFWTDDQRNLHVIAKGIQDSIISKGIHR